MLKKMIVNASICLFSRKFNTAILEANLEGLLSLLWDDITQMRSWPQLTPMVLSWWVYTPCSFQSWWLRMISCLSQLKKGSGIKSRLDTWWSVLSEARAGEPRIRQALLHPGAPIPSSTSLGKPLPNPRKFQNMYGWEKEKVTTQPSFSRALLKFLCPVPFPKLLTLNSQRSRECETGSFVYS